MPPVELLRSYDIPIAIASDFNPGTSPFADFGIDNEHGMHTVRLNPGRGAERA